MQPKSGFSISFWGVQCQARTKTVRPITQEKKRKKKATKDPRLPTRTKELSEESQSLPKIHTLAEKQPRLFALHPDCKVNKAENKVCEYEDDEEDEIKLVECGQVEAKWEREKWVWGMWGMVKRDGLQW